MATTTNRLQIVILILQLYYLKLAQATYRECDYEKYSNTGGCFAAANFICDTETNLCKCTPEAPILIDGRYCLKRSKENDICENNKQCDNSKGIYCSYSDYRLVNSTLNLLANGDHLSRQERPRCRYLSKELIDKHKSKSLSKASSQQTYNSLEKNSNQKKGNSSASFISYLPRIILMFLIGCIVGLIVLLILIKTQFYKIGRSFQEQPDDHLSINSELEEPPPYEIAIRMKL